MSKLRAARKAVVDGGVPELTRRTRIWLASRIYPGELPRAGRPRRPRSPKARQTASDVDRASAVAWFETRRATYEKLARAVSPHVDPDGVFFDVGANVGYFTKILCEMTAFRGIVHLFEPVPNLARIAAETLEGVPFDVHLHEFGLGAADTSVDLFIGADGNLGWNTIVQEKAAAGVQRIQIDIRAFADLDIPDVPQFIKIDVEGAESQVLRGMLPALRAWTPRPAILCEVGWGKRHPQWEDELDVFDELSEIGYRATDLDGVPVVLADLERTTDVIFVAG